MEDSTATECVTCRKLEAPGETQCRKCGKPLTPASIPYVLAGKFRFEYKIGAGGMRVVYRAVDLNLGRTVAVKTLPHVSPEYSMRLRREARAMAAVEHPNLALIFGAETWRGIPMLVFEFLDGGTLADRLRRGPMQPREVITLGIVLSDALHRVHAASVLHRDVKPSNILFTRDGVPKLLDFGLARLIDDSRTEFRPDEPAASPGDPYLGATVPAPMTSRFHVVGTPAYMSPEALNDKPLTPGFDLWSLSVVLFESLTGYNPFVGATMQDTMARVSQGIPSLPALLADCPQAFVSFLSDALSPSERRRPPNAMTYKQRLESVRSNV